MTAPTLQEQCQKSYLLLADALTLPTTKETAASFLFDFMMTSSACAENRVGSSIIDETLRAVEKEHPKFTDSVTKFVERYEPTPTFDSTDETLATYILGSKRWILLQSIKDNLSFKNRARLFMSTALASVPKYSVISGFHIDCPQTAIKITENTEAKIKKNPL